MPEMRVNRKNIELVKHEKYIQYDRYKVTMPKNSTYEGYYFLISPNCLVDTERMKTPQFIISVSNNYIFELVQINREEGKRYPRLKVTALEMQRELTLGNDTSDKMWLANITQYGDKGRLNYHYLGLGILRDKWFYPVDSVSLELNGMRKQTNSYGLVLIKEMDESEIKRFQKYLAVNDSTWKQVSDCQSRKNSYDYYIKGCKNIASVDVTNAESALRDMLTAEVETVKSERIVKLSEFADFIAYNDKQWNEEKRSTNKMTEEVENA